MKKSLNIDYMRKTLKIKTGVRAGKNDKPGGNKPPKPLPLYGVVARYAIAFEEP